MTSWQFFSGTENRLSVCSINVYEFQSYETKNDPSKRLPTNCAPAAHSLLTLLELCTVGFRSSSEKKNERHEACAHFFEQGMTFENKLTQIVPDIIGVLHYDDQGTIHLLCKHQRGRGVVKCLFLRTRGEGACGPGPCLCNYVILWKSFFGKSKIGFIKKMKEWNKIAIWYFFFHFHFIFETCYALPVLLNV